MINLLAPTELELSPELSERKMKRLRGRYDESLQLFDPILENVNRGSGIMIEELQDLRMIFRDICSIQREIHSLIPGSETDAFMAEVVATSRSIQDIMNSVEE